MSYFTSLDGGAVMAQLPTDPQRRAAVSIAVQAVFNGTGNVNAISQAYRGIYPISVKAEIEVESTETENQ